MGFGFLESVYEKCLMIELADAGLQMEEQKPIQVYYHNELVGKFVADIVVDQRIIVELKSVRKLAIATRFNWSIISLRLIWILGCC